MRRPECEEQAKAGGPGHQPFFVGHRYQRLLGDGLAGLRHSMFAESGGRALFGKNPAHEASEADIIRAPIFETLDYPLMVSVLRR